MVVLLPLAACYRPTYRDCAVACENAGCPNGLTCIAGFCRANGMSEPACVDAPPGPPNDVDNDSVLNEQDNCPERANTDQANEDKDAFGDVCDPCPVFGDPDNNDMDGDGVGNGCDPNPMDAGDVLVLFHGFNEMPTDAAITGNWIFIDGQARISDSTLGGPPADLVWTRSVPANESVLARIKIANLAGPSAAAGIISQLSASNGFSCVVGFDSASNQKLMLRNRVNTIVDGPAAMDITVEPFTMDERRTGQEYKCYAPKVAPMNAMYASTVTPSTATQYGLRAYDTTAQYDWVMVIGSP